MAVSGIYSAQHANTVKGHLSRKTVGEVEFFEQFAPQKPEPILELACAGGRMTTAFATLGYHVFAIDGSPRMIEIAKTHAQTLDPEVSRRMHFVLGDMRNFLLSMKFKFVMIPFHSFWWVLTEAGAEQCLDCILKHLTDDGVFVIDTPPHANEQHEEWWHYMEQSRSIEIKVQPYSYQESIEFGISHLPSDLYSTAIIGKKRNHKC